MSEVRPELIAAAADLGFVHQVLRAQGNTPLGRWAVPWHRKPLGSRLLLALSHARAHGGPANDDVYRDEYWAVIPKLQVAIMTAAATTLARQEADLRQLGLRLSARRVPERLRLIALEAAQRAGGLERREGDVRAAQRTLGTPDASWAAGRMIEFETAVNANTRARVGSGLAASLPTGPPLDRREVEGGEAADLARILWSHPEGLRILTAYTRSAESGTWTARMMIAEAAAAIIKFAGELRDDPNHAWRYTPLVLLGIQQMGLAGVAGFTDYALDLGHVLDPRLGETSLMTLGMVIMVVGVVFAGPLAYAAVATVDLALSGSAAALVYLRQREQNLGAAGSAFRAEGLLAEPTEYGETFLAGAAALVSAMALVRATGRAVGHLRTPKPPPVNVVRGSGLELGERGTAESARATLKEMDRGLLTERQIARRGKSTPLKDRIGNPSDSISWQKMTANARTAGQSGLDGSPLGSAGPRELDPAVLEDGRGVGNRLGDPAVNPATDYNTVPDEWFARETSTTADPRDAYAKPLDRPTLTDLERANARGRTQRGPIVTREEQLFGIEAEWNRLLRERTPTEELRNWAKRQLAVGAPDPILPSIVVDAVEPDHIVAIELIRQFPGFNRLSTEAKLAVLNLPENIMAVSRRVNRARGSMPYADWPGLPGHPLGAAARARMVAREDACALLIQRRIDYLLTQEMSRRGMTAVVSGGPPQLSTLFSGATKLPAWLSTDDHLGR